MYTGGVNRAEGSMSRAEKKGRAITNPYAKEILDEYVLPLAAAIRTELDTKRAGRRIAHVALLHGLDVDAVAFLAVRTALNDILVKGHSQHRRLGYAIGKTVHSELVLAQIEDHFPDLFYTLTQDFGRRLSKDERHRMTVYKMQAAKQGLTIIEWPVGARDQVGLYLLGLLEAAGMVNIDPAMIKWGRPQPQEVHLSSDLMRRIDQVRSYVAITMPEYGPCVEPPKDWTGMSSGGFHTKELRRTHPHLVRHRLARSPLYQEADMPEVYAAVNALQRTAWQVNREMLDLSLQIARSMTVGEVTSLAAIPKPGKPEWLESGAVTKAEMTEEQQLAFKSWKREVTEWHTTNKTNATKYGRFYSATRSADFFKDYPQIYFVYFADSRGRLYPMTYGLNPQGSDFQRALIRFAKGMPVDTPEAIRWFHVQGANKWGFDKATLEERQQWVVDRQDLILSFASDPMNNTGWKEAGDPWQFLAWCLEYRDWVNDTSGQFLSYLPISMDGSCNGLQNLSALLRDEVGGKATNLTDNAEMEDIYRRVAEAATKRLQIMSCDDTESQSLRDRWIAHGVSRSVVKRSVMTTPYGVTKRTATEYVIHDYLSKEQTPFQRAEYMKAATLLMAAVWPAIGDVVVKGREAMDWLQRSCRAILKDKGWREGEPVISWISPSGFPASQAYFEVEIYRIHTRLHGQAKVRVHAETEEADQHRHINGLAPNFVHSMDAAHLHRTTAEAARQGINHVAMIHDDYGTHAANAQKLFDIIRQQFVQMYETHDPISDFASKYPVPPAPAKGSLDIREVLNSRYFFS